MLSRRSVIGAAIAAMLFTLVPTGAGATTVPVAHLPYGITMPQTQGAAGLSGDGAALMAEVPPKTVVLRVPDYGKPGYRYEVWASRGNRELAYTGRLVQTCASDSTAIWVGQRFGCHRSYRLHFGARGVRKVRLVVKNSWGTSVAENTFFLADPFRARFVAKLAVRHCADQCRADAQRVRALADAMPDEAREALRGFGAAFYHCAGIEPTRIVMAAARTSASYARSATRAEWEASLRLDRSGVYRIFPSERRFLDHHDGLGEKCAPCIAEMRMALEGVVRAPAIGFVPG